MNSQITQTDLNLAINYMVMERVARCMGAYDYLVEEHDWIEVFFEMAAKGKLRAELMRLGKENQGGLVTLFEQLHNIFGLDGEVLSGERQIDLGVAVDQDNDHAVELATMSMDDLDGYIEQRRSEEEQEGNKDKKQKKKISIYSMMPWENTKEAEALIDTILEEQIGCIELKGNEQLEKAILKWSCNPLGINTLGLFVYLIEEGLLDSIIIDKEKAADKTSETDEILGGIYASYFEIVKYTERYRKVSTQGKNIEIDYIYSWKQNVYCLDSIIYSFLRKRDYLLEGYTGVGNGRSIHKVLDEVSDLLPAPLKLVDENSELLTIVHTLWATNCDEYGGYHFDFKYAKLIEYSGIKKEIQHQKRDILPLLKAKLETLLVILKKDEESMDSASEEQSKSYTKEYKRTRQLEEEIRYIEIDYLPALQRSLQLFESDKQQWIENQIQSIEVERARLRSQQKDDKSSIIRTKLKILDAEQEKIKNRATRDKPIPWIKVREPYYEYISI